MASTAAAGLAASKVAFAVADCVPPTISYDGGEIRRGETIRVIGTAWGDACLDTPPPSLAGGPLGQPLREIELFVSQGDTEYLVASGGADDGYGFEVTVVVPPELAPGPATVVARSSDIIGLDNSPGTLTVSAATPVSRSWNVASFGPEPGDPSPTTAPPDATATSTTVAGGSTTAVDRSRTTQPMTAPSDGSNTNPTAWIVATVAVAISGVALWGLRRSRR